MSAITKTVKHLVHMGDYESVEVEVSHTIDIPEGVRIDTVLDQLDKTINDALEPELAEARKHCDEHSYLLDWRK